MPQNGNIHNMLPCYHVTMLPCYPSVYKTRHTPVSQIPPLMSTNKRAETGLVSGKFFTHNYQETFGAIHSHIPQNLSEAPWKVAQEQIQNNLRQH